LKTYYDCIPCFIRQALEASRFATSDENIHEKVLRKVLLAVSDMDFSSSPPEMAQFIHRIIRKLLKNDDPYREVKEKYNLFALELYPELKKRIKRSSNPMETAVRLAIAGNIIDFGVFGDLKHEAVEDAIKNSLTDKFFGDIDKLFNEIFSAKKILYLGDNTGEIVMDRLLIEQMPMDRVTFVVRGGPVINDATIKDAQRTGMTDLVHVIDNGSDAPGTILKDCSDILKKHFHEADLVIAKGQGNYETLSEVHKNICFLLKAKCHVIARHIGCEVGSLVVGNTGR